MKLNILFFATDDPRISCEKYTIMTTPGNKEDIVCTVYADPVPTKAVFIISRNSTQQEPLTIDINFNVAEAEIHDTTSDFTIKHKVYFQTLIHNLC